MGSRIARAQGPSHKFIPENLENHTWHRKRNPPLNSHSHPAPSCPAAKKLPSSRPQVKSPHPRQRGSPYQLLSSAKLHSRPQIEPANSASRTRNTKRTTVPTPTPSSSSAPSQRSSA